MSMAGTIQVLNRMVEDGIIQRYAIGGAVAALNYVEPVGRPKDLVRIDDFVEQEAVDFRHLRDVLERHSLLDQWAELCRKTGRSDPLALIDKP